MTRDVDSSGNRRVPQLGIINNFTILHKTTTASGLPLHIARTALFHNHVSDPRTPLQFNNLSLAPDISFNLNRLGQHFSSPSESVWPWHCATSRSSQVAGVSLGVYSLPATRLALVTLRWISPPYVTRDTHSSQFCYCTAALPLYCSSRTDHPALHSPSPLSSLALTIFPSSTPPPAPSLYLLDLDTLASPT
ncbi:hypothetical protein EIP91_009039 [Steccherinum ochraceum]|uniref:Uncharacterized protein n=1 Tax=Steccherinum ochraceum TaxID=92696 RepID=A0A4R0R256_9APHY|nr:hypothetical protein EIP91_009039 [Steccherinum ochraceum]